MRDTVASTFAWNWSNPPISSGLQSVEVPCDVCGSTARDAEHGARLLHEGFVEARAHGDQRRGQIGATLARPYSSKTRRPRSTLTVTVVRQPVQLLPHERDTSHTTHGFAAIQQSVCCTASMSSVCANAKENSSRCKRTSSSTTKSWPSHPLRRELLRATFRRDPGSLHQQVPTPARVATLRRHNTTTHRVLENLSQQDCHESDNQWHVLATNPNAVTSRGKVVTHLLATRSDETMHEDWCTCHCFPRDASRNVRSAWREVGVSPGNPASVPCPCGPTQRRFLRNGRAPRHTTSQTQQTCPMSAGAIPPSDTHSEHLSLLPGSPQPDHWVLMPLGTHSGHLSLLPGSPRLGAEVLCPDLFRVRHADNINLFDLARDRQSMLSSPTETTCRMLQPLRPAACTPQPPASAHATTNGQGTNSPCHLIHESPLTPPRNSGGRRGSRRRLMLRTVRNTCCRSTPHEDMTVRLVDAARATW